MSKRSAPQNPMNAYPQAPPTVLSQTLAPVLAQIPQAPAAESAYLGGLLRNGAAGVLLLDSNEFRQLRHQLIYAAIFALKMAAQPVDHVTVGEELRRRGELELVGGPAYLQELRRGAPKQGNADEYVRIIRQHAVTHGLLVEAERATQRASNGVGPALAIKKLQASLSDLSTRLCINSQPRYSTDSDLDGPLGNISWLWPGWVLRGFVTGIVGQQETGKSSLCLDLCQRLLGGAPWPDCAATGIKPGGNLLWIDTEMALAAFRQRLEDWGLPRGNFILPEDPLHQLQLDNEAD